MIDLHPSILEKNGRKEFVILPFEEFEKVEEELSLYEDLKDLREAKEKEQNTQAYSFDEAKKILDIM
jgi:PHD/YefM family antitoxin component YafN of YafNO toxin-antitoxin module